MLTLFNFSVTRGENKLFRDINITLFPSCILCVYGRNGAGKTSMLRAIATIGNWNGDILSHNQNIQLQLADYRASVLYIGHKNALDENLTVMQNLKFWAELRGMQAYLEACITHFQLARYLAQPIAELSQGWQKKVELAKLLLSKAQVWLLDEPFAYLDTVGKSKLLELLQNHAQRKGVTLFTSQKAIYFKEIQTLNFTLHEVIS